MDRITNVSNYQGQNIISKACYLVYQGHKFFNKARTLTTLRVHFRSNKFDFCWVHLDIH